jgi:hypothetical protein
MWRSRSPIRKWPRTEVEFRHKQARTEVQCGGDRRDGGNRRRARCGHRGSDRVLCPRRGDSLGSVSEGALRRSLTIEIRCAGKAPMPAERARCRDSGNKTIARGASAFCEHPWKKMSPISCRVSGTGSRHNRHLSHSSSAADAAQFQCTPQPEVLAKSARTLWLPSCAAIAASLTPELQRRQRVARPHSYLSA